MKKFFLMLTAVAVFALPGHLASWANILTTAEINQIQEENRTTAEEIFNSALFSEKQQNWDLAVHKYKRAADLYPELKEAQLNLGNIFYDARRFYDAITHYKKAVEIDPHYFIAHMNMGLAYYGLARYTDAVAALERGRLGMPNYTDGLYFLGRAYSHIGEHEAALGAFEAAVQNDQGYYPAHFDLAHVYMTSNKFKKALKHFKYVKEIAPNHEDIRHINTMIRRIESIDLSKPEIIGEA